MHEMAEICALLRDASIAGGRAFDEHKIYKAYRLAIGWFRCNRHIHQKSNQDNDLCKKCGLDLRDEIHLRIGE